MVTVIEARLDPRHASSMIARLDKYVVTYNAIRRSAWQWHKADPNQNLCKGLQAGFGIRMRIANSVARNVCERYSALEELKKAELRDLETRIEHLKKEIDKKSAEIDKLKPFARQNKLSAKELDHYRKTKKVYHDLCQVLNHVRQKYKSLESQIQSDDLPMCYGTKRLFDAQNHLELSGFDSHEEWLGAFQKNRDKEMILLGRNDETFGNQLCRLERQKNGTWKLYLADLFRNGQALRVPVRISHPDEWRLQELFDFYDSNKHKGKALSVRFVRRKKGWYVQFLYDLEEVPIVTDASNGVIGVDFNRGHIDIAETDASGNLIGTHTLELPAQVCGGGGERGLHETRKAIKEIVEYALSIKKDVIIEGLDFRDRKSKMGKKAKGYNRMLSGLNYAQYNEAMERAGFRHGVRVTKVNPAYTSQIGEKIYRPRLHVTVHVAAAYTIARRGQGLEPKQLIAQVKAMKTKKRTP